MHPRLPRAPPKAATAWFDERLPQEQACRAGRHYTSADVSYDGNRSVSQKYTLWQGAGQANRSQRCEVERQQGIRTTGPKQ